MAERGRIPLRAYRRGDRVRVETSTFAGVGVISDISTSSQGYGSKLYPAFLVDFDNGTYGWFNGVSLRLLARG